MIKSFYLLLMAFFLLQSCSSTKKMDENIIFIAPYTKTCNAGIMKKDCYLVKWSKNQEQWEYFYNEIENFIYEKGYFYTLKINVKEINNPPADASSLQYNLIKILDKKEACSEKLNKNQVLQLLEDQNLLLKPKGISDTEYLNIPSYQPNVEFDYSTCQWTVTSHTYEPVTMEGDCAQTNGCTPEIQLKITVDAMTSEIMNQEQSVILHPNYE